MVLPDYEAPVTYSMVKMAVHLNLPSAHLLQAFTISRESPHLLDIVRRTVFEREFDAVDITDSDYNAHSSSVDLTL